MHCLVYRYQLARKVRSSVIDDTIVSAIAATRALYGDARSQLEIGYARDRSGRTLVVDATLPAGRAFARILAGLLLARFGSDAIRIKPVRHRKRGSGPTRTSRRF